MASKNTVLALYKININYFSLLENSVAYFLGVTFGN